MKKVGIFANLFQEMYVILCAIAILLLPEAKIEEKEVEPGVKERNDTSQAHEILSQAFDHKEALIGYAFCIVKNWQTAEDVVQEAFLVIRDKWEDFQLGTSVFAWSRNIVRFECFRMLRRLQRETPIEQDRLDSFIELKLDNIWDESAGHMVQEQMNLLRECVSDLPTNSKQLLLSFYLHGHSYKRISDDMDKSIGYVKDNLYRLRRKLRNCVRSKKFTEESEELEVASNSEFLDDIYYEELLQEDREVILNKLEKDPEMAEKQLLSFLVGHVALAVVSKQMHFTRAADDGVEELDFQNEYTASAYTNWGETESSLIKFVGRQRVSRGFRIAQGLVACFILCVGLVWWSAGNAKPSEVCEIVSIRGVVTLLRENGAWEDIQTGSLILPGDIIKTEEGGTVSVRIGDEDSIITLKELSKFKLALNSEASNAREDNFYLYFGELEASIARQSSAKPMMISTDNTDSIVLGTHFRLIKTPVVDRLDVLDGRVKFLNFSSGSFVIAKGGESFNVFPGTEMILPHSEPSGNRSVNLGGIPPTLDTDGLVRAFHFERLYDHTVLDSSPFLEAGICNNISGKVIMQGRQGRGLRLNDGGYVYLGKGKELRFEDSFTIGFHVMFVEDQEEEVACLLRQDSLADGFSYKIIGGPEKITMTVNTKTGETFSVTGAGNFRKWKLVVFTLKHGMLRCYTGFDTPVLRDSVNIGKRELITDSAGLFLGNRRNREVYNWVVDDLIIYNRALSLGEIHELSLLHHVRMHHDFESAVAKIVHDISPLNSDAELVGDASIADGKFGKALTLNGAGFARIKVGPRMKNSTFFEFWVRGDKAQNPQIVELLSKKGAFQLSVDNKDLDKTELVFQYIEDSADKYISLPVDILDARWHHVVMSFSKPEKVVQLMVDEKHFVEAPCSSLFTSGNSSVYIGGKTRAGSFVGQVDNVHFSHISYQVFQAIVRSR